MKLLDSLLLAIAIALFIIGIDQTISLGLAYSYWIFMLAIGAVLLLRMIRIDRSRKKSK